MSDQQPLPPLTDLLEGRRIDWERVVLDIQRSAWLREQSQWKSLRAIAHACGRGENWAWSLKNIPNTEPKFHDALLLIGLWAETTGGTALPLHRESERATR